MPQNSCCRDHAAAPPLARPTTPVCGRARAEMAISGSANGSGEGGVAPACRLGLAAPSPEAPPFLSLARAEGGGPLVGGPPVGAVPGGGADSAEQAKLDAMRELSTVDALGGARGVVRQGRA